MKEEGEVVSDQGGGAGIDPAADRVVQIFRDAHFVAAEHQQEDLVGVVSPLVYIGLDLVKRIGVVHPESSIPDEVGVVGERGLGQKVNLKFY